MNPETLPDYHTWLTHNIPKSWSVDAAHHLLACEQLDRIKRGEIDRLAIFMPPRHGKTENITARYPVYHLLGEPESNVLITGYNERFARRIGRKARNVASERLQLDPAKKATDEWATVQGGVCMTRGVGSPPTGTGFKLIVIDDPIRRREDAESETYREKVWDWYTDDLYTRLEPGGAIILVMCLTGDTSVLMDDGTEKAIRDVRKNDQIATYENGKLSVSKVLNWSNQGSDVVFTMEMESGIIVKGNERHPFLVERDGYKEWVRIRNLKPGDKILRAKRIGENGGECFVSQEDVKSQRNAEAFAIPTTTNTCGALDTAPRRVTRQHFERVGLKTGTALPLLNMTPCLPRKKASALYAAKDQKLTRYTGAINSVLTMTMLPAKFVGFCAITATSLLDTRKQKKDVSSPLSTFEIIPDCVVSITLSGCEDVFDIQVERTENFIANGLVSHNTPWHEDDIGQRAIASEPGRWEVLRLPALAEENDPLNRPIGEALWKERFNEEALHRIRDVMSQNEGLRSWEALYQCNPTPREGSFFAVSKLKIANAVPATLRCCRAWDLAATKDGGDYTVGVKIGTDGQSWYILDVVRGQWDAAEVRRQVLQTAQLDGTTVKIHIPQDGGQAGKDQAAQYVRMLAGFSVKTEPVSGKKEIRANPLASQVNVGDDGNVRLFAGGWNATVINEFRSFPTGKNDDIVDAASDAFTELAGAAKQGYASRPVTQAIPDFRPR